VPLASEYPFLDIVGTMIIFFAWVAWIWIAISIFSDVIRRDDIGGGRKTAWIFFVILIPFLGVFVYLLAEHDGMQERTVKTIQAQQTAFDDRVKQAAGGPAEEITRAKELRDSGAITDAEFEALKAKALA
jgi:hypothetical protein